MPQDYYLVLGIAEDASQADIKEAYRRLAKEYHPDHYKGNHRPFQAIQEAYSALSDPARRRQHDLQTQDQKPLQRRDPFSGPLEPLIPGPAVPTFNRHFGTRNFQTFQPFSTPEPASFFFGPAPGTQPHPGKLTTIVRGDRKYSPQTGGFGKNGDFWDFLQNIF
jgi:curved DNA-binding protein CbpA